MNRKIEINTEEELAAGGAPAAAQDSEMPQMADHVNPVAPATANETVDNGEVDQPGPDDMVSGMESQLEEATRRAEEAETNLRYGQAELQNAKRRLAAEKVEFSRYASGELIKEFLPILDNFERALAAAETTKNFDALVGGVSGTLKQIHKLLQNAGVKPIEAVGKEFDPTVHEAIGHTESSEHPENTVAEEVQRGYMLHDRVLRASLVRVSKG